MQKNEEYMKEKHKMELEELEQTKNAEVQIYRKENSQMRHIIANLNTKIVKAEKEIAIINDPHAHCILKSDFEAMRKELIMLLKKNISSTNTFESFSVTNDALNTRMEEKNTKKIVNENEVTSEKKKQPQRIAANFSELYSLVNKTIRTMTETMTIEHQEIMKSLGKPCHEPVNPNDIVGAKLSTK